MANSWPARPQPRPQGAFPWLWTTSKGREKRPGDEVGPFPVTIPETLAQDTFLLELSSCFSLRTSRLEVVGERENGRARGRHALGGGAPAQKAPKIVSTRIFVGLPGRRPLSPRVSPSRARGFSCAHYFQAPATQTILVSKVANCSLKALVLFLLLFSFVQQISALL